MFDSFKIKFSIQQLNNCNRKEIKNMLNSRSATKLKLENSKLKAYLRKGIGDCSRIAAAQSCRLKNSRLAGSSR